MTLKELHDATTIFTPMDIYEGGTNSKLVASLSGICGLPEGIGNRLVSVIDVYGGRLQVHIV